MGLFNRKPKKAAANAVGSDLAACLPNDPRPWYRVPHLLRLNLLLLIPLISSGAIGYDGSMMNGLQTLPQWRNHFGQPSGAMLGAINAVYPAGKVLAMFVVTYICDRFGRKIPLVIGVVTCIAFAIMQGMSNTVETFIAARAILGFFTSFLAQPSPILISELAYPTMRGKLTALYHTSFYLGGIIAAWCTYGTFRIDSTWSWRIPSILQGALPALQLAFIYFLPESPRWLIAHGRQSEARKILVEYHAGGEESSPLVEFEMREIEQAVTLEADVMSQNSWLDLVRTPANRKRTLIAFIVGWFAQFNGAGVISYYLFLVLNTIGITEARDQTLINGLLQISNWLSAVFAGAMMVDRLGRRTIFLGATSAMCACYAIWTGLTAGFVQTQNEALGRGVVAFIFIYFFFYACCWAPLLLAYTVEIFPYTLRSRGVSTMYVSTFVSLVVSNQVNPIAMQAIGWRYYIVFICILAALVVIIYFVFPETKGYSLEEIQQVFEGGSKVSGGKLDDIENAETDEKQQNKGKVDQVEVK
ncbi:hypothetical protein S40288_05350 [Stachybotrys chartarum IBT 40288]|nr:hypothetical protein S40288_05350 [Stachybotrys chartarum IBT 40288]